MSQLGSIFEPEGGGPRGRDLRAEVRVPAWACGQDDGYRVEVPRELPALGGYARRVASGLDTGDELQLRLPPDFPDGGTLRLRGQGEASEASDGRPGDLLLTVHLDLTQTTPPPGSRRTPALTWPSGQALASPGAPPNLVVLVVLVFAAGAAIVLLL
ncbi:MAG: hypothetical protein JNK56_02075 [Myxococcales bacterium]|nr:hypothetical protein [Myxococcales bacterium]